MLAKILMIAGLVSAGLLLIILTGTTPASAGAVGILSVFLLSYIVILTATTFLLWFTAKLINKILTAMRIPQRAYSMPLKKAYYFSTIIASAPVILISLQSVGNVGVYEVGLILLFLFLGCIYVGRRST